jgi:hypothetical protein
MQGLGPRHKEFVEEEIQQLQKIMFAREADNET